MLKSPLYIKDSATASDGGSYTIMGHDADGNELSFFFPQYFIAENFWLETIPGRLYVNNKAITVRSELEKEVLDQLKHAIVTVSASKEVELPNGFSLLKEVTNLEGSGDYSNVYLVKKIIDFVESDEYVEIANQFKNYLEESGLDIPYPEIKKAGSLVKAIQYELNLINSGLTVQNINEESSHPLTNVAIINYNKFVEVGVFKSVKTYSLSFSRNGTCIASGHTTNIKELVSATEVWLNQDIKTLDFTRNFEFVGALDHASAFDNGTEIEYYWNKCFNEPYLQESGIADFIAEALKHKRIQNLFPFMSMDCLCLSRCTGYPYTTDIPAIIALGKKEYRIVDMEQKTIFEGQLDNALEVLLGHIPENVGRAKSCTAEDL
jgi:hypothetical protein